MKTNRKKQYDYALNIIADGEEELGHTAQQRNEMHKTDRCDATAVAQREILLHNFYTFA